MAKKQRNEFKVGLTVLAALVVALYIVITLADWSNLWAAKNDITFSLPYHVGLKGLAQGSPVFLGGAKIGQVVSTRIAAPGPEEDPEVRVYFTIRIPAAYPLRTDCRLAAESNLLGGQAVLTIRELGTAGELLADGASMPLHKRHFDGGIQDTMANLQAALDPQEPTSILARVNYELDREAPDSVLRNVVGATASLDQLAAGMAEEMSLTDAASLRSQVRAAVTKLRAAVEEELDREDDASSLAKVRAALDELYSMLDTLDDWTTENAPVLTATLADVRTVAGDVSDAVPGLIEQISRVLDRVETSVDVAKSALEDARAIIGELGDMFAANRGKLDRMIDDLRETGVNLRVTTREVRRAPWRLLYQPRPEEVHLQAMIETAGRFVTGAERLTDLSLRLRALMEQAQTPEERARIQSLLDELEETFKHFNNVQQELWQRLPQ